MKKNIAIIILSVIVLLLLAVTFLTQVKSPASKTFSQDDDSNKITESAFRFSERERARKYVYEILVDEMLINTRKTDSIRIDCGTYLTPSQYDEISEVFADVCNPELVPDDTTRMLTYHLFVHLFAANNQSTTVSNSEVDEAIRQLNAKYAAVKIRFEIRGREKIISEEFEAFNENQEALLLNQYKKNNYINIFIFKTLTGRNGARLNGYTSFQQRDDHVMITGEALMNGTTLPHEIGHYFLLFHTHGKGNNNTTDELVNDDACSCKGDDVCDTPADPNLYGKIGADCIYKENKKDPNGSVYKPDPMNIMSYAHLCRKALTKGQYNRVRWAALKHRNYFLNQRPF